MGLLVFGTSGTTRVKCEFKKVLMLNRILSDEQRNNLLHQEVKKYKQQGYIVLEESLFSARLKKSLLNPIALRTLVISSISLAVIACLMVLVLVFIPVAGVIVDILIYIYVSPMYIIPALLFISSFNKGLLIEIDEYGNIKTA